MTNPRILHGILVSVVGLSIAVSVQAQEKKVRLFILSGQSNMAGLNPKVSFTPTVTKAFEEDEVIVVKDAQGGQPIRRWYKQWKAPEGRKVKTGKPGDLYDRLMTKVNKAIKGKKLYSVSFVWMQGERDAREKLSAVYAKSMSGLIEQLRDDLKRPDMTVVIGRLSDFSKAPEWEAVRKAQVDVAEKDKLADWVDTDDLNGKNNGLHYNREGYAELGTRFAQKTIALLKNESKKP